MKLLDDLRQKYTDIYNNIQYDSLLETLAEYGHVALVQQSFKEFLDTPNTTPNRIAIPLYVAARVGFALVQWLLKTYPIECTDYQMAHLIGPAARSGDIDLVKWLMKEYPDSLREDAMKDILLEAACSENFMLFKLLMEEYFALFGDVAQNLLQSTFVSIVGVTKVGFVIQFFREYSTHLTINENIIKYSERKKNYDVTTWLRYRQRYEQPQQIAILPIRFLQ